MTCPCSHGGCQACSVERAELLDRVRALEAAVAALAEPALAAALLADREVTLKARRRLAALAAGFSEADAEEYATER